MPHSITPVAQHTTSLTVPDDAELANAASLDLFVQVLADRAALALEARKLVGPLPRSVYCTNGADLKLEPIRGVLVTSSSVWRYVDVSSTATITVANLSGGGSFTAGVWYYVYVYYNAGSPAYQISTTVPDTYLLWKTGSTDYAYICAFMAQGASAIPKFKMRRGHYKYLTQYGSTTHPYNLLLAGTSPSSSADVSCTEVCPPHSRAIDLFVTVENVNATNPAILTIFDKDVPGLGGLNYTFSASKYVSSGTVTDYAAGHICGLTLDSSQRFRYTASGTLSDVTASLLADGWYE